ncbi:MAG: hypothetical protein IH973_07465, partial [Myxococcales bacterium]|nr:hypothetical protein [Myxococcales bacterium]
VFKRTGQVIAGRYHVQLLTSPQQVRNALRYVLLNIPNSETAMRRR